ncbi:MAG: hypothetical protein GX557_05110 [Chloroflexi bacterium]|nr:hypothetical protein [Chloroflexota bacterium]
MTNDRYATLRRLLAGEVSSGAEAPPPASALDEELRAWRAARQPALVSRPSAGQMRMARRQVNERVGRTSGWQGEWSLVRRLRVLGAPLSADERAARQARVPLERYGVVTRAALEHGEGLGDWGTLYRQLQVMALRGEVRRGYFVQGLPGVQFALPEALEALRGWDAPDTEGAQALVLLNACDPANVLGEAEPIESDAESLGARLARIPSNYIVLQRGVVVLTYEHGGARWQALAQAGDEVLAWAVELCTAHLTRPGGLCGRPRRVLVNEWNGASPLDGPAQALLEGLGFRREPPGMLWDGMPR